MADDNPCDAKPPPVADPGYSAVARYLRYTLSLPERAVRSGGAVVGGAIRESAALLVPQAFQNSKTYSVMVRQMLDFLAEDVGGVKRQASGGEQAKIENFVARKAVGNFVEMAGLATLHLSPLTLLAAVSDIAYGSQVYLQELADELKARGVIDSRSTIHHVDDLLTAVAAASSTTASAFDTPPLSVEGLRQTIAETRAALATVNPAAIVPQAELARMWGDIREIAGREGVGPLDVSGAMTLFMLGQMKTAGEGALSSVRVAGRLLDRHVVDHYAQALGEIRRHGLYATLRTASQPYVEAVWKNFATSKTTITEDLLAGKLLGQGWNAVRGWLGGRRPAPPDAAAQ